jgi:hypothetical protein
VVSSTLNQTLQETSNLTNLIKHASSLKLALRASINIAQDISNRHAELLRHSGELSAAADRLQQEEEVLTKHAHDVGLPLVHYNAVDRIGILVGVLVKNKVIVRGLAKIKVDNAEFPEILDEIDDAVEYFARESGGPAILLQAERTKDWSNVAVDYYRRALALQEAALFLIREAVVDRISQTTADVSAALNIPKVAIPADKLEASLVYTRFHGISSRSHRLLALVKKRLYRGEPYHELLQSCRSTYCVSREALLKNTVLSHMDKLRNQHGLVGMTRLASVFMIRLCTVETSLYLDFFGEEQDTDGDEGNTKKKKRNLADDSTFNNAEFQAYLTNLCATLHHTVRRGLVTVLDLDTLCQIVSVLREERSMAGSSPTTMAAARAISGVIQDAQERLIFCANSMLNKQVIKFKATPQDLDYPNKLQRKQPSTASATSQEEGENDAVQQQLQVYESWFPPMRSVLRILSKIFRVVEPRVFEDLALECVQACTVSLKEGSEYIRTKSGVMHADLFLVKHLLILREQLSPFDIELRAVERQLDFSDAGKAVSRFLANRNRRLFSMSTENALLTLMREGVSVHESSVDSKRDLEDALRGACNDFIEHTTLSLAKFLVPWVSQCQATKSNLSEQAYMKGECVQKLVVAAADAIDEQWNEVTTQMALYLESPATRSILLKPVSRKISRLMEEVRQIIHQNSVDGENGWDAEIRANILKLLDNMEHAVKVARSKTNVANAVASTYETT